MQIALADIAAHLPELVARADAGEEIVLTRDDAPSLRMIVDRRWPTEGAQASKADRDVMRESRRRALEEFRGVLKGKPGLEGVTAANIADDLYDENGLPA